MMMSLLANAATTQSWTRRGDSCSGGMRDSVTVRAVELWGFGPFRLLNVHSGAVAGGAVRRSPPPDRRRDSSPGTTRFACAQPTVPGVSPRNCTGESHPPTVAENGSVALESGDDGAAAPVATAIVHGSDAGECDHDYGARPGRIRGAVYRSVLIHCDRVAGCRLPDVRRRRDHLKGDRRRRAASARDRYRGRADRGFERQLQVDPSCSGGKGRHGIAIELTVPPVRLLPGIEMREPGASGPAVRLAVLTIPVAAIVGMPPAPIFATKASLAPCAVF